jgi:hypothetical protein
MIPPHPHETTDGDAQQKKSPGAGPKGAGNGDERSRQDGRSDPNIPCGKTGDRNASEKSESGGKEQLGWVKTE